MSAIEILTARNRGFAAGAAATGLSMMPTLKTMIIGCVDPRVDPAHVLGVEAGDAVVIRNVGGRITPATLQSMALLRLLAGAQAGPGPGWSLIVLHHTDCGIKRLTAHPQLLAEHLGVEVAALESKHVEDPRASVRGDVEMLKANPFLPAEFMVSGLVYDVATGLVEQVAGPEPLRRAG